MGELAGGLAHELNQPLCAISNYAETCIAIIEQGMISSEKLLKHLRQIAGEAGRAGSITGGLRRLIEKVEPRVIDVSIEPLLTEVKQLLDGELKRSRSHLVLKLEVDLPTAKCDPIQIQQIVVNLVRNSIDSMADLPVPHRSITVTVSARSDEMLEVVVCDRGCGLPVEKVDTVFDAFYTTKDSGLGLGLAICRSMAESIGGSLTAEDNDGAGATFRLSIPTT